MFKKDLMCEEQERPSVLLTFAENPFGKESPDGGTERRFKRMLASSFQEESRIKNSSIMYYRQLLSLK